MQPEDRIRRPVIADISRPRQQVITRLFDQKTSSFSQIATPLGRTPIVKYSSLPTNRSHLLVCSKIPAQTSQAHRAASCRTTPDRLRPPIGIDPAIHDADPPVGGFGESEVVGDGDHSLAHVAGQIVRDLVEIGTAAGVQKQSENEIRRMVTRPNQSAVLPSRAKKIGQKRQYEPRDEDVYADQAFDRRRGKQQPPRTPVGRDPRGEREDRRQRRR